jgi:hypothetical protein
MADRFPAIGVNVKRFGKALVVAFIFAGMGLLSACESVSIPDMPKFDFNLGKEKPVVTIKSNYNKVNIRPTPSTQLEPVASLAGGDPLQLLGDHGDWLNVGFYDTAGKEQAGWIYKYLVEGYEKPGKPAAVPGAPVKLENSEQIEGSVEQGSPQFPGSQELPKSNSVSPL